MFLLGAFAFPPANKGKEVVSDFVCSLLYLVHRDPLTRCTLPLGLFCGIFSFKGNTEFILEVCLMAWCPVYCWF